MINITNRTSMKPGNPRFDSLILEATRELESFLVYNPSRRASSFIRVTHSGRGEYKAAYGYTSNQGTSTKGHVYSKRESA